MKSSFINGARRAAAAAATALLLFIGLVAISGATAQATPTGDGWGFALVGNLDLPPYPCTAQPDLALQAVSSGLNATACTIGFARYRVTFPRVASAAGVAHVTAVSNFDQWCQVAGIGTSGPDQFVDVQCYQPGGVASPAPFSVMFATRSPGSHNMTDLYAYVRSDALGQIVSSFNGPGGTNSVVKGPAVRGQYRVTLTGLNSGGFPDGHFQVTAESASDSRRCKVANWAEPASGVQVATVHCFDHNNTPADSQFNLTFQSKQKIYGAYGPPLTGNFGYDWVPDTIFPANFNSKDLVNSVTSPSRGQAILSLPRVGVGRIHAQATAYGPSPDHCTLQPGMRLDRDTAIVATNCFDGKGSLVDSRLFLTYTSDV